MHVCMSIVKVAGAVRRGVLSNDKRRSV
jgi:hypothetical protein